MSTVRVIISNENNIAEVLTFKFWLKEPISDKKRRAMNITIADVFASQVDNMFDFPSLKELLEDYSFHSNDDNSMIKNIEDSLKDRLSKGRYGLQYFRYSHGTLVDSDEIDEYKLGRDNNVIIFSAYEQSAGSHFEGIGFYDDENNKIVGYKKYSKIANKVRVRELDRFENLSLIGLEAEALVGQPEGLLAEVNENEFYDNIGYLINNLVKNEDNIFGGESEVRINIGNDIKFVFNIDDAIATLNDDDKEDYIIECACPVDLRDSYWFEKDGETFRWGSNATSDLEISGGEEITVGIDLKECYEALLAYNNRGQGNKIKSDINKAMKRAGLSLKKNP